MSELSHADYRIAQNSQVRSAAHPLDRIGSIGFASVKMSESRRRQVTASRRTHDSNAGRIYLPFRRPAPDRSNGTLHILHHHRVMVAMLGKSVLEYKTRQSLSIQKQGVILPFVRRKSPVAAARADDHGRARSRARSRKERSQQRDIIRGCSHGSLRRAGPHRKRWKWLPYD